MTFNYYRTKLGIVTAKRAEIRGLHPHLHYGYYVTCTPRPPSCNGRMGSANVGLVAWCRTKAVAERHILDDDNSKIKGYHGCPHGCDCQARSDKCPHGIPADMTLSIPKEGRTP